MFQHFLLNNVPPQINSLANVQQKHHKVNPSKAPLHPQLKELVSQRGGLSRPLLKTNLSEAQWSMVEYMNEALRLEYSTRHSMLLQRLDLTIQSFLWSHKVALLFSMI